MDQKISALVITYNEEKNIQDVISCLDFADEIIIVDSFSKDNTINIARQNSKVRVYQHRFEDFTKQRNIAISYAKHDWILFLDADERLTKPLQNEIKETINNPRALDAYYVYRTFFFCNKKIRFSGTQNDKNFRLFKKSKAKFCILKKVHETLNVNGTTGILKHKLLHYSFSDYKSYKDKMIHYGVLKGQELYSNHKRYNILTHFGKTSFRFFKAYIIKLGILDGKHGLDLSYLQSLSVHETYVSLKRKEQI
ncbi:glycosyltransferase family 2 protein [Sphingobacterium sp. SG20118]|uniref:glycosyltransferase family 2 protein n=1 Tax=Sphingobacterium sp. SG20118 TaxID=3367156 RepID=UPI0037DFC7B6